jgi:hypothetical protein
MKLTVLALAIVSTAPQFVAAQAVTITGDTTGGPTWNRPVGAGPSLSDFGTNTPYNAQQITITDAAGFSAAITSGFDSYLHLYLGDFNPADQLTNLEAGDDDRGPGEDALLGASLTNGRYTIVVSGFDNGDFGSYTLLLNGVVIVWGLGTRDQIDELRSAIAQSGRQTLRALATNTSVAAQASLQAQDDESTSTVTSTMSADSNLAGRMNVWGKLSNTHGIGARDLRLPTLQLGADYAITPDMVAGLAIARGSIKSSTTGLSVSGKQTIVQPYLGWRNGDLRGAASLSFGRISYDTITTTAGTASAKGTLRGFSADIAKDYAIGGGRTISPFASLNIGQIKLKDTTGTLAAAGIPDSVRFREVRLGTTFAMAMGAGVGKLTVSADHFGTNAPIAISSGTFDEKGWSGTIGLGYQAKMASGWTIDAELNAGGIGSDTRQVQGGLKVGLKF